MIKRQLEINKEHLVKDAFEFVAKEGDIEPKWYLKYPPKIDDFTVLYVTENNIPFLGTNLFIYYADKVLFLPVYANTLDENGYPSYNGGLPVELITAPYASMFMTTFKQQN